jgi:hypothetical protein
VSGIEVTYEKLTAALHARYGRSIAELHQEVADLTAANEALLNDRDQWKELAVSHDAHSHQAKQAAVQRPQEEGTPERAFLGPTFQ